MNVSMPSPKMIGRRILRLPDGGTRRWYDDAQVGTEVFLGGGLVEVHVGRRIWQTVTT